MNNMSNNRNYNPNNNIRNNQRRSNNGYQRPESNYGADYAQKFANRDRIQRNDKNKVSGKYGNICNTLQKKFNMTLYQGQNNNNNNKSGSKYRIENNCRANQNKAKNQNVNTNRSNNERSNNRFNIIDSKSSLDKNKRDRVQFNRNFNNKEVDNRDRKTALKEYSEIDNISTQIEEETNALPKSVFVYITVAVAFVAILIFIVAKGGTQGNKINRVDNSKTQQQVQEDNGLNFDDIEDEASEGGIELGEGEEEVNPTENQLQNPDVDNGEQNIISTGNTSTNGTSTSAKPTLNTSNTTNQTNSTQTNSTVSSTTTTNNKKPTTNQTNNPTTNNSNTEEEEEEEVVEENVPMSYIPMQVTGMLYHCSGFYGSYGATGGFQRYTKFQELGNGIRVPTKDLNGIWIDVRGMKIIEYVGYKAGEKTTVVRIELENSDSTSCGTIYALKGTFVTLGGTYRKKNSTSTFTTMFAETDVELIKIGS